MALPSADDDQFIKGYTWGNQMVSISTFKVVGYRFAMMVSVQLLLWSLVFAEGRDDTHHRRTTVADPTKGFVALPLTESHMEVQWPYDLREEERYSYRNGVHTLKVYSTDKPHARDSHTKPRTEIRIKGYDYSSGVWQFEGQGYVPGGTSGVCIMQVFGGSSGGHASTVAVRVYDGKLAAYRSTIAPNIYNRWFQLNVIHDVRARKIVVYVDRALVYHGADHGGNSHYFKFGVYAQNDDSNYMESRWKGIKIFNKN